MWLPQEDGTMALLGSAMNLNKEMKGQRGRECECQAGCLSKWRVPGME